MLKTTAENKTDGLQQENPFFFSCSLSLSLISDAPGMLLTREFVAVFVMEGCLHVNGLFSGGYGSFFLIRGRNEKQNLCGLKSFRVGFHHVPSPRMFRGIYFWLILKAKSRRRALQCFPQESSALYLARARTFSHSLLWVSRALMLASKSRWRWSPHSRLLCLESASTFLLPVNTFRPGKDVSKDRSYHLLLACFIVQALRRVNVD